MFLLPHLRLRGFVLALSLLASSATSAATVLMVTAGSTLSATESARRSQFEAWGYTVATIEDSDSQANFNAALSSVDVVYVPESVISADVGYKLRETPLGIVNEERALMDEFGISSNFTTSASTHVFIIDASHPITSPFGTTSVTVFTQSTNGLVMTASQAPGLQVLGLWNSSSLSLGVLDVGATLVNTYNSNNTAAGRRVQLPFVDDGFDWGRLTNDGLTIIKRSIEWAVASQPGLIGHWKLDETSGTTAADSSGAGNDGTYTNGPVLGGAGVYGNAAAFDGVNDYVTISGGATFNLRNSLTVSCWAKSDNSVWSGYGCLVSKRNQFYLHPSYNSTYIYFGVDHTEVGDYQAGFDMAVLGPNSIQDWHHYVGVYDEDALTLNLYVDGILRSTFPVPAGTVLNSDSGNLTIGWDDGIPGTRYFDGQIDDVRLYNKALSEAEVAVLCGLIGHWKFDEGLGTTVSDSSGNANDASFNTGTPTWVDGVRGKALQFDGTSDAVTGTNVSPPETGAVALWIRSDGPPTARQRPWGVGSDYEMWQDSDGLVSMDLSTDGYQGGFIATTPTYTAGRWYHFVAQYNSETDAYEIYINGQPHKSGVSTWNIQQQAANLLTFGTRTGSTERFSGALDDFRIYNRWLSAEEIANIYGLVGHWKLDENSGSIATDSSGAGLEGAYANGAAPGGTGPFPGSGGNAAEFNGAGAEIDLPAMEFDFSDGFAASFWVKPADAPGTGQTQAFLGLSNGTSVDEIWLGWVDAVGLQLYLTDTTDGSTLRTIEDNTDFVVDQWVHCVAVVDASGNATLYRDGQVAKTGFYTSLPTGVLRTQTSIGTSSINDHHDGLMRDVRLYNRPLQLYEVAELHGLVSHWKLDEGAGSVAADSSLMGNDATFVSGSWLPSAQDGAGVLLNGATDYLQASGLGIEAVNDEFSLAGWVRADGIPDAMGIITKGSSGQAYSMTFDDDNTIGIRANEGAGVTGGSGLLSHGSDGSVYVGEWKHVAVSYAGGIAYFYINGALDSTQSVPGVQVGDINQPLYLGRHNSLFFQGALDDLRVYNRAISAEEAAAAHGSGASPGIRIIRWVEAR